MLIVKSNWFLYDICIYAYEGCWSYSFLLLSYLPSKENDISQNNYFGECDQSILHTSMKLIIYTMGLIFVQVICAFKYAMNFWTLGYFVDKMLTVLINWFKRDTGWKLMTKKNYSL